MYLGGLGSPPPPPGGVPPPPPPGVPPPGPSPPPCGGSGSPSNSGSLNSWVAFLKSRISKCHLPLSVRRRVPRPTICLNSVIEPISLSITISPQVLQSTPVDSISDVVTTQGYFWSTSMKLSNCFLPTVSSPVIRITYLGSFLQRSEFILTSNWRIASASSMSVQNTIVLVIRPI